MNVSDAVSVTEASGARVLSKREEQLAAVRLRVAMVIPAMNVGGMEILVLGLTKALRTRGHYVEIVCTEPIGALEARIRDADIPVLSVPAPGVASVFWPRQLEAYLRRGQFDIVHSHSGIAAKAARAARLANIPGTLHTLHGVQHPLRTLDLAMVLAGAFQTDINVGCSEDTVAFFRHWTSRVGGRVAYVRNGIDVEVFRQHGDGISLREEHAIPSEALVLGSVGRLDPVKNQRLLIDAIRELDDRWHLLLVGDGPLRDELAQHAQAAGVAPRVHFAGMRTVTADVYGAFDVFALSSLSEAMPMTILEAFCARVPVVAPRVGGIASLLSEGRFGSITEPGSAASMARAVRQTVEGAHETRYRIDCAYSQLLAVHTVDVMASEYESLYRQALSGRPR